MKSSQNKSGEFHAAQFARIKSVGAPLNERDRNIPELLFRMCTGERFSLLDIGCGLGKVARCAKDLFPNAVVHGVDISPDVVAKAKTFRQDIQYQPAGERELPFSDDSFEYATCRMSIHHYPEMVEHLREAARVLKPGGIYLIMDIVPESGEQDKCLNDVFLSAEQDAPGDGHVKFYTKNEYESLFSQSGFVLKDIVYSSFPVTWPKTTDYYKSIVAHIQKSPVSFPKTIQFNDGKDKFSYTLPMGNLYAVRR